MTETEKNTEMPVEPEAEAAEKAEATGKKTKKSTKKLETENAELRASLDDALKKLSAANDDYLRLRAEFDNFRRRTMKEKEGVYSDTVCDVVRAMLPVLDNLERAVQYTPDDAQDAGIAMILKNYIEILKGLGVTEIEAQGAAFDPNLHNAIMHVDDENYGENEIYNVVQKGYIMGERVIRHALVMVAN